MLALVVLASASFNVAYAAKKKKKKAEETVQPVQLASPSDSLSYVVGMVMTNGLIPYLQQAEGVDTAYMADFIRGFNEMIKSGDDPKVKAYSAGMGIAARLKGQMLEGMKKEFTDTPDTIVAPLVYRGFTDALQGDTTVMKADEAEAAFKAAEVIGYPECRINLAQAAIYNALAPKSNACEAAIDAALADVHTSGQREVPNHLRDRHRPGSDEYGPYLYPHDYPEGWVEQRYLPEGLERGAFWKPAGRGWEEWRVEQSARDRSGRAPETSA